MKSYDELTAETETKKNKRRNVLKEVKHLCKEFVFTTVILKGWLTEGWTKK